MLIIRPETAQDYALISQINDLAFGQKNESRLVENLRRNKKFISRLSPVAQLDNEIVGHILFFTLTIKNQPYEYESVALPPIAVLPAYQRRAIGSALIHAGLAQCRREGFCSVIVLGHPEYYPRFGFRRASTWKISAPFDVPEEAFMAMEPTENGLINVQGSVVYPDEFREV